MGAKEGKVCIIPPPGLQALLMCTALIRETAATHRSVLVYTHREHLQVLPRLFHGISVTFWFETQDPAHAAALGYRLMRLPRDPFHMYAAAGLSIITMYTKCYLWRDLEQESRVLEDIVDRWGPTFVLVWTQPDDASKPRVSLNQQLLPPGVPVVDATTLPFEDRFDLCTAMCKAQQVHAVDSWFLTLADLVGGPSRKFCHAYASPWTAPATCRKKYRRRVSVLSRTGKASPDETGAASAGCGPSQPA